MLYTAISTVTTGLVVYGLSRLTALVVEVQTSRAEIARMAVLRERLRFARDLHDLLGYSLSAITLKIELTHRLLEKSPQEASDQLLEILEISRLALSDARTVASGYRELSLEEECRSAVSVLAAADISVQLDSDHTRPAGAGEHRAGHRAARGRHEPVAAQQGQALRDHHPADARRRVDRDRQRRHPAGAEARHERASGRRRAAQPVGAGRRRSVASVSVEHAAERVPAAGRGAAAASSGTLPALRRHSQPASRAMRIASTRLRAASLLMIVVR